MMSPRIAAAIVGAGAFALPLAAQSNFKKVLPANTVFFASAPDIKTSLKEFEATPLYKMWRESEVQDFVADGLKMLQKRWLEGLARGRKMHKDGKFPFDPDMLMKLRLNSIGIALTSIDVQLLQETKAIPRFGVVLHADFGATADMWRQVVDFAMGKLEEEENLTRAETEVEGVKVFSLSKPGVDMSLNWAFHGSSLVVGSLRDEFTSVMTNLVKKQAVLTESKSFQMAYQKVQTQGAEMEFYVQPALAINQVMKLLREVAKVDPPPEEFDLDGVDRAITALGLRSLKQIVGNVRYEGAKSVTRLFCHAPEPERKGLFAGQPRYLDMKVMPWIPKDAANFWLMGMHPQGIYDALTDAAKAYNKDMAERGLGQLAQMEKQLGMSVREDLLGSFGHKMLWWSMGMASFTDVPEWGMLFEMKDKDKLLKSLNVMTKMSQGKVQLVESERRGVKTWTLEVNPEDVPMEMVQVLNMLRPCFSFQKGHMVAALSTSDVRRATKRMNQPEDSTDNILHNKWFAAYKDVLPKQGMTALAWTDWKATFENVYQAATSVVALLPQNDDMPFDLTLLPEGETLSQHLFGQVQWTTTDAMGYSMTDISPIGPEVYMSLGMALGLGAAGMRVAAPVMGRARAMPKVADVEKMEEEEEVVEEEPAAEEAPKKKDPPKKEDK